MARRRKNQSDVESVIWVLLFIFIAGYFLIKWAIELIAAIIAGIVWLCIKIAEKIKNKKKVNSVTVKPFENTTFVKKKVDDEDIITKFELKDFSKFDSLFEEKIIPRGIAYYNENKIVNIEQTENKVSCIANGTDKYNVEIKYESDGFTATCTCPYYEKDKKNCKHIYAALLKSQYGDKLKNLISEIEINSEALNTMLNNAEKYINNHRFSDTYRNQFYTLRNNAQQKINLFKRTNKYSKNQNELINVLKEELELKSMLQEKIKKILDNESTGTTYSSYPTDLARPKSKDNSSLSNAVVGLAMLNALSDKDEDIDDGGYSEKELDMWGLTDEEKEIVRTTEYEAWDFDEDNVDEDSYYYEDDK